MTRLVALGDSFTCGEGVGVRTPAHLTWVGQLAARLPDAQLVSHAVPGARVADVRSRQLPAVVAPDLVTLLVGLNDVARAGFDAARVRNDLVATTRALTDRGATVLVGRLHDPGRMLPLPARLRRLLSWRLEQVNAAVDLACGAGDVHPLDLAAVPALRVRQGWAVDRLHPSPDGHAALAAAAAEALRGAGWALRPAAMRSAGRAPSRLDQVWWLGRHGFPCALTHALDLGGPALAAWRHPLRAPVTRRQGDG